MSARPRMQAAQLNRGALGVPLPSKRSPLKWLALPAAWVVLGLSSAIESYLAPIIRFFLKRHLRRHHPEHNGLRVIVDVPDPSNEVLYQARVVSALELMAKTTPRHLAWLRNAYDVIYVGALRGGKAVQTIAPLGILRVHPRLIWRVGAAQTAIELVPLATPARLSQAGGADHGPARLRIRRHAAADPVWAAHRIPGSACVAPPLLGRLKQFPPPRRRPPSATPVLVR